MKKTIKIIAFVLLLALAVWSGIVTIDLILQAVWYVNHANPNASEEAIKSITKGFITDIFPYFAVFILLILIAFFIMFDFYFKDSIFNIKSKLEKAREKSKQKKYDKLKSKIEKMESDE